MARSLSSAKTDPRWSFLWLTTQFIGADFDHKSILFDCTENKQTNKQVKIWKQTFTGWVILGNG
jgi:hypothetical protein